MWGQQGSSLERMRFDEATATTPVEGSIGLTKANLRDGWSINGNANGGYLIAVAARAMVNHVGRPDPVTITAHFLAPGSPGPVTIQTRTVKEGRRFATATASMTNADGRQLLQVLGAFTDLTKASGPELVDAMPPDLPPVEDCDSLVDRQDFSPELFRQIEVRLHPEDSQFAVKPSGVARSRGWFRLPNDEPMDTLALVMATDALPPTVFNANLPLRWVPTVELTAHLRARPAPGWLRCEFRTRFVTGGFLEEDGLVWDSTDQLVAQSRQLALVPVG